MKVWWLDPKIINKTCNTEENGTTSCIEWSPMMSVDNMATRVEIPENAARFEPLFGLGG